MANSIFIRSEDSLPSIVALPEKAVIKISTIGRSDEPIAKLEPGDRIYCVMQDGTMKLIEILPIEENDPIKNPLLKTHIKDIKELPPKTKYALENARIFTVNDITQRSLQDMLLVPNLDRKEIDEIKEWLEKKSLSLR